MTDLTRRKFLVGTAAAVAASTLVANGIVPLPGHDTLGQPDPLMMYRRVAQMAKRRKARLLTTTTCGNSRVNREWTICLVPTNAPRPIENSFSITTAVSAGWPCASSEKPYGTRTIHWV